MMGTVAVVGAGLSGLTAAYRLQQAGWEVTVLEARTEVGGRVQTVELQGHLIDTGATGIGESYAAYFSLARELGIGDQVVAASPYFGIYRDGQIHLLRLDRMLSSGIRTKLLSPWSKVRALRLAIDVGRAKARGWLDYADMRKAAPLDTESSADYARRALNPELGSYLCEPVVRLMLIADADVSKVELFSGLANIFGSRIYSLRGGQGRLPRMLAERLHLELSCPVEHVADAGDHVEITYRGEAHRFDAAVLACPLPDAAELCPDRASLLGPLNEAMGYTKCLTVAVGTGVKPHSPAMLVELPRCEDEAVALMFLDHNKCSDRAPAGRGLIGCCWEADAAASMFGASDEEIAKRTLATVLRVFPELRGKIEFTHVSRWARALPHTQIGAYRKIGEFNARLDPMSRIQFAADYMSAAGQNTAVEFGNRAAEKLGRALVRIEVPV